MQNDCSYMTTEKIKKFEVSSEDFLLASASSLCLPGFVGEPLRSTIPFEMTSRASSVEKDSTGDNLDLSTLMAMGIEPTPLSLDHPLNQINGPTNFPIDEDATDPILNEMVASLAAGDCSLSRGKWLVCFLFKLEKVLCDETCNCAQPPAPERSSRCSA